MEKPFEAISRLSDGITGKDVIITLCGVFNKDEVLNHAIEFTGEGIKYLSVDQRLAIANMTTEWGALAGVFPVDEVTIKWLTDRVEYIRQRGLAGVASDSEGNGVHPRLNKKRIEQLKQELKSFQADEDAYYSKTLSLDLGTVQPHVSGPNTVKVMSPLSEIKEKEIKIDKAYLVSCVNSRFEDIKEAAEILRGKKIAEGVKFYVAAASSEVQQESENHGYWQAILDSGAIPLPPGCGPCIGLGTGLLEDGEVGISATNRNFKGRMGSPNAQAYLASPVVVAASALSGKIDYPWEIKKQILSADIKSNPKPKREIKKTKIIEGFPGKIEGRIIFCYQDNLNTDGIYPGKYTYIDDFKPEDQAGVVMENYDPEFKNLAKNGDILVGGYNFGTGSSREQAATALKYKGIRMVIVGSSSQTYVRNAFNNGFLVIEVPELVDELKTKFGSDKLTVAAEFNAVVDFKDSKITFGNNEFNFNPLGAAAQELIVAGGLENWVKKNL